MNDIIKQISEIGIVPVIKLDTPDDALPLAKALCAGGLPLAEITFRTDAAEESIKRIAKEMPEMLVGAGTVLTLDQAERAIAAGAKFIVTPGFNAKIVKYCVDRNVPVTPGCTTPTDVEAALEFGLTVLKFFPAEQSGGLDKMKSLCGPYTNISFMPTGGINLKNLTTYLAFDKIVACGGSFMVKDEYIKAGEFDKITELTKNAVSIMLGFETPNLFDVLAAGDGKAVCVKTNSCFRAVAHLAKRGIACKMDTAKYDAKGKLIAVTLEKQLGGCPVELVQK